MTHSGKARDAALGATRLTLTFDNGPTPVITERALESLARFRVRTTFFVIGQKLLDKSSAALLGEIKAAGHWIGNHTLSHTVAFGERAGKDKAYREIEEAQSLIGAWPDQEKLFRPYGKDGLLGPHLFSAAALSHLRRHAYTTVIWNLVPGDWRNPEGWDADCLAALNRTSWPVVVLHDIADACLARLPDFLARISDLGISIEQAFPDSVVVTRKGRFVTLSGALVADGLPTSCRAPAPRSGRQQKEGITRDASTPEDE
jgi:peptidoglycan/xylan/chitin deacetylase (PgdA/CDA1 family)